MPRKNCGHPSTIVFSLLLVTGALATSPSVCAEVTRHELAYAPAPVDNPLKGLVPYLRSDTNLFPCSMEFNYLPLAALVTGEQQYDWQPLENLLEEAARRGHQAVFRIYLEFPGRTGCCPDYLVKGGLRLHRYNYTNTQPLPHAPIETPDYADPNLRRCLRDFIAALGKRYDGDRRIGFITAGLLGVWGEWHDYPHEELWAGKDVQGEVLNAYAAAFHTTPILLRYPAGEQHHTQTSNAHLPFGYHDDSFAWATLETGRPTDNWFFLPALKAAGPAACDKWKHSPIGGEIRPEAWGKVFDEKPDDPKIQDFQRCVAETHVSWLMDSGLFQSRTWTAERRTRAAELVRRMGYEFHVPAVTITRDGRRLTVEVEVVNRGVAPFYYDWPVEFALLADHGRVIKEFAGTGKLTALLPGNPARIWKETLDATDVPTGSYQLAMRVPNPLLKGNPIRFANRTQDQHAAGWLTLAAIQLQ